MARHEANNNFSVTTDASVPLVIQRSLRRVEDHVSRLVRTTEKHQTEIAKKISMDPDEMTRLAKVMRDHLQSTGSHPLSITNLPGVSAEPQPTSTVVPSGVSETPSGVMNGSNAVFTLSSMPTSLYLYLNGVLQMPTVDYTLSGATVTFTIPPKASDLMLAGYTH